MTEEDKKWQWVGQGLAGIIFPAKDEHLMLRIWVEITFFPGSGSIIVVEGGTT